MKQFILKSIFNILSWFALRLIGGYPPIGDKEKMRSWTLTNIENRAMPLALCTETKIDDEIWKIVKQVVENDVQWDVLYELLQHGETVPDGPVSPARAPILRRFIFRRRPIGERSSFPIDG